MLIDMKVFYKLIILSLMGLARDAQNTQLKHQAVRDNFVKKTIKPTSTSIVESLYSSCHSFQFASNSLPDLQGPKMAVITAFGRKKIGAQIRLFLACLCCQKQLKQ